MKVIISGAGIGGLTTALCLHKIGCDVEIFEAVSELRPLGVGINLLPHGAAVLHSLGLGQKLDEFGVRTRAIEYRTRYGHVITSDPRGVEAGFEFPQYSIHRGLLQFLLLDAVRERLGANVIKTGIGINSFSQSNDLATAHLTKGEKGSAVGTVDGSILIGADGFHSALRKQLHPNEGPPRYEGMMMWRGISEQESFGDGRTMFIAGNQGDDVNEYTLAGPYCLNAVTFVDSFSVQSEDSQPQGLTFTDDGLKMFVVGKTNNKIFQYTLAENFDVSTASYTKSFSVNNQETKPSGMAFDPSGRYMFIVGIDGDDVTVYKLSENFDVSTAVVQSG